MLKIFGEAWKNILEHVVILSPQDMYQALNSHIWWNLDIQGIGFGFSRNQAARLDKIGHSHIQTLWDFENNKLLTSRVIVEDLNLIGEN